MAKKSRVSPLRFHAAGERAQIWTRNNAWKKARHGILKKGMKVLKRRPDTTELHSILSAFVEGHGIDFAKLRDLEKQFTRERAGLNELKKGYESCILEGNKLNEEVVDLRRLLKITNEFISSSNMSLEALISFWGTQPKIDATNAHIAFLRDLKLGRSPQTNKEAREKKKKKKARKQSRKKKRR